MEGEMYTCAYHMHVHTQLKHGNIVHSNKNCTKKICISSNLFPQWKDKKRTFFS